MPACNQPGPHGAPCRREAGHRDPEHQDAQGYHWIGERWDGLAWAPPPPVAATITALAAQVVERLAVLARVRPLLNEAIRSAATDDESRRMAIVATRVAQAILRD